MSPVRRFDRRPFVSLGAYAYAWDLQALAARTGWARKVAFLFLLATCIAALAGWGAWHVRIMGIFPRLITATWVGVGVLWW